MLKWWGLMGLLLCFASGNAQSVATDTVFLRQALDHTVTLFTRSTEEQAWLNNGSQYLEPAQTHDEQHPFFISSDWVLGSIKYDGDVYENVYLLYDITGDKIVTEFYANKNPIVLVGQKVSWFVFSGRTFEWINPVYYNNSLPNTGFYEILYPGKTKVVARRVKEIHQQIEGTNIRIEFNERNKYYVLKNGQFAKVTGKSSVLKLLVDKKADLRSYLRREKIRFNADRERALKLVTEEYDRLKNVMP